MSLFLFIVLVVTIEHITDLLTNVDLLENIRIKLETIIQPFQKIVRCRFCQSFWLSGLIAMLLPGILGLSGNEPFLRIIDIFITWLVLHKAIVLWIETMDRYLGRIPANKNIVLKVLENEKE